ncbi:hypothetical protein HMPREF1091_00233 [Atopobium minutum 10063974]|uniref:Uncharacterized protein n=1 Tax=Atopobium minutum 10063974 TaxID=997872 RepID=N2BVR9_9ACTN|nr:hypothetical protein HMPREF1091_00233 [Atopobium minutum 10063974]ERL15401.1 hypothetical protein HMPREF1247_0818 [Atopobium sp. BV3Ac4]
MHHYITKYEEDGHFWSEAWIQINIFDWCFCFWKVRIQLS